MCVQFYGNRIIICFIKPPGEIQTYLLIFTSRISTQLPRELTFTFEVVIKKKCS